jgi:hypothetical protein
MNALLSPNMSAPGAPQAHDGVEPRLELWHLWSPNPIRQVVNVQAGSILNIALEGHEFQGTVLTNVTPGGLGSNIRVTGTGNGPEAWWKRAWNDSVGWTLFTARNLLLAQGCNTLHGVAPYAE